jgi:hypothetical protein
MKEVKFDLELQSPDSQIQILEIYDFLQGEIPGLKMQLKENPDAKKGTMSAELLPVIQMVLGSTVVAAVINGIFSQIKDYFEFRRQKTLNGRMVKNSKSNINKGSINEDDNSRIIITRKTKDGTKEFISINNFSDEDRKQLFEFLNK